MSLPLTKETVEVLKNLATINETLLFPKDSSTLITRSVKKHTYAQAEVEEVFPKRFVIYDLNQFLSVVGQFDNPILAFDVDDSFVQISDADGGLTVDYLYCVNEELAFIPGNRKIELPSVEVEIELTEAQLKSITNMARTLGTPELALISDGKTLKLKTLSSDNTSANTLNLKLGKAPSDATFQLVWKIEYLKLIPGTYKVSVSKEGISRFEHVDRKVVYHVLLEANSSRYEE